MEKGLVDYYMFHVLEKQETVKELKGERMGGGGGSKHGHENSCKGQLCVCFFNLKNVATLEQQKPKTDYLLKFCLDKETQV